jgi:type II secretory pathway pseudopilin PulG
VIAREGGYTTIELVIVMAILGTVVGAIVTLFTAGINADARQNQRYQSQQDVRLALDRMRKDIHSGCSFSSPGTYNSPLTSATIYYVSDNCAAGSHTISWCTVPSGSYYALYRIVSSSCTGATQKYADYLTSGSIFVYLPPNAHLVTSTSLGQGTSSSYIVTQDGSSVLPRLHVDLTSFRGGGKGHPYRLVGDIAFRNGARACNAGVASC